MSQGKKEQGESSLEECVNSAIQARDFEAKTKDEKQKKTFSF